MTQQPVYRRIRTDLEQRIAGGEFDASKLLPSEHALAARYGVARMTVRQAISELVRDGLLVRRRGRGTFVSSDAGEARPMNRLSSFTEDFGCDHVITSHVLSQGVVLPPPEVGRGLQLGGAASAVQLERLRRVDDRAVSIHRAWLPLRRFPALARMPLEDKSLYAVLESEFGVRPWRALQRITAAADRELARLLELRETDPLIAMERLTFDEQNEPIELARTWSVPDIPLWVELKR